MESQNTKKQRYLLPHSVRKIGLSIIILSVIIPVSIKLMGIDIIQSKKEILKLISKDLFILGLFFVAFSRDKIEDELTILIRLRAMSATFAGGILIAITYPIISLLFGDPIEYIEGNKLITFMLFNYLFTYYTIKGKR